MHLKLMNDDAGLYFRVREREGRLYPDGLVKGLPVVPANHPLQSEWNARTASSDRLVAYLSRPRKRATLLELGCGNGWLSHRIACVTNAVVVGLDRDSPELRQARRVFSAPRLVWISADIYVSPFPTRTFDFIVIASAIQYFADLPELFGILIPLLAPHGEIHILDSPLYSESELPDARERSKRYYEKLGFPEMAARYHHHRTTVLAAYNPSWLYRPHHERGSGENPLRDSPFPWVCLRSEF